MGQVAAGLMFEMPDKGCGTTLMSDDRRRQTAEDCNKLSSDLEMMQIIPQARVRQDLALGEIIRHCRYLTLVRLHGE